MWYRPEWVGEVMITLPKALARSIKGKSNVSVTLKLLSSVINDIYKRGCINGNSHVMYT